MRTPIFLIKDLQNKLKETFKDFPMRVDTRETTKKEEYKNPSIWIGQSPPKKATDGDSAPLIIIRILDNDIKPNSNNVRVREVKISLLCFAYIDEKINTEFDTESGYMDVLNMVDRVFLMLCNNQYYANNHWRIEETITSKLGIEKEIGVYEGGFQNRPIFGGVVLATFTSDGIKTPTTIIQ